MEKEELLRPVSELGQRAVLKALIEQDGFYNQVRKMVTPNIFSDTTSRLIMRTIMDFEREKKTLPSFNDLSLTLTEYNRKGRIGDIELEIAIELIKELATDKYLVDMTTAKDIFQKNCEEYQMLKIAQKAQEFAKEGKTGQEAQRALRNELDNFSGVDSEDMGSNPWDDIDAVLGDTGEEHITTGLQQIDDITGGGLERGCLGTIISRSGGGKTTMCSYMANKAALAGKFVIQITFEDKINDIHRKHYACMTGKPISSFKGTSTSSDLKKEIWQKGGAKLRENLVVKHMINQRTTVDDIFNFVASIQENRGRRVDALYIDYFDCLKKEGSSYKKSYENDASTIKLIEAMAAEYDIAVWVFQQTNRDSLKADTKDNGAANQQGGLALWQTSSLYIILKRSKEDIFDSRATLDVDKNRFGQVGEYEDIYFDNGTCQIDLEQQTVVKNNNNNNNFLF